MSGRRATEIKQRILETLSDGKPHTYAELERKVNSNWQTIRDHCEELEIFACVGIRQRQSHPRNDKPFAEVTITSPGKAALARLLKKAQ